MLSRYDNDSGSTLPFSHGVGVRQLAMPRPDRRHLATQATCGETAVERALLRQAESGCLSDSRAYCRAAALAGNLSSSDHYGS
jgi:hypothetical protein